MKRAEAAARAFQAEQDNAKYTGAAPALDRKTTVAQYAEAWAETKHTKRSAAPVYLALSCSAWNALAPAFQ